MKANRRREDPLRDAQRAALRLCLDAGYIDAPKGSNIWRTARSLERRGLMTRTETSEGCARFELTEAGREAAATVRSKPEAQPRHNVAPVIHTRSYDVRSADHQHAKRAARVALRAEAMAAKKCVKDWNERYPVGTLVDYHAVIGEPATAQHATRSEARQLPNGEPVVWLEDKVGCVSLRAVTPIETDKC